MSLAVLANHMASKGRGPDSMLIHMSPREVQGLQALAVKNGGSLTVNPETGLPEAGFLDKLLPTIIGLGASYLSGGTISPAMIGLGLGAVEAARTGDLGKGISAGLGAYGGAGLGEGLFNVGTNALTTSGLSDYAGTLTAQGLEAGTPAYGEAASKLALESQKNALAAPFADRLSAGAAAVTDSPGALGSFAKDNFKYLAAGAAPILADQAVKSNMPTTTTRPGEVHTFSYNPYGQSYTPTGNYPASRKTETAADGGLMGMDAGGYSPGQLNFAQSSEPVVRMANGGYPSMSEVRNAYAARSGSSGYTPRTMEEFDRKYNRLTGGSKQAYDYLTGKTKYSATPYTETGEIMKPYSEAVVGFPVDTVFPKFVFDPVTRKYINNPLYTGADREIVSPGFEVANPRNPLGGSSGGGGGGGSDPTQGTKTDWGNILGDETLTGKDWSELTPAQQDKASSIVDPYGIGKGIAGLFTNSLYGKMATGIGNFFSGRTSEGGYDLGFNQDALGTGKGTQSEGKEGEDTPGKAAPGIQAQQQADAVKGFETTRDQTAINAAAAGFDPQSFTTPGAAVSADLNAAVQSQVAADMQSMQDAYNADMSAAQSESNVSANNAAAGAMSAADTGGLSNEAGSTDATSAADNSGNTSSDPGGSSGDGTGGEARGGLNLNGKYYPPQYAHGGIAALAQGGMFNLGDYSDGGRLLRGPGDGVSDSIPATIGKKRPARLADGEFVVPARIVSELGNGSTEAGARKLYAMMDRIQAARRSSIGKGKVAKNSRADKHLPA